MSKSSGGTKERWRWPSPHGRRRQKIPPEEAQRALVETFRARAATGLASHPNAAEIAEAVARLLQGPGRTLSLKLMPKDNLLAAQAAAALLGNPAALLDGFDIEAKVLAP